MRDGPNIVNIAAMVGDHTRTAMLTALMSGQALTATELATEAGVTKQTASGHLAKLLDTGLVLVAQQGRHRYYQLADDDVAQLLESLMGVAERTGSRRVRPGPNDPAMRKARVCYDHLAGDAGVALFDAFKQHRLITVSRDRSEVSLTTSGKRFLKDLGISTDAANSSRRPTCRACLDWSVRRYHLAGVIGAGLLDYCYACKWAKRRVGTRVVQFSTRGDSAFKAKLLRL